MNIETFVEKLNEKFPIESQFTCRYTFEEGKRYYKISTCNQKGEQRSAYGFVDKTTGDLYKAASWKAPAKHIRGNINDESGLNACDQYGVKCLR